MDKVYEIFNDDCVEAMRKIPENTVNLTVTSPPYDSLRAYKGAGDIWNWEKFRDVVSELYRVTVSGGCVIWVVNDQIKNGGKSLSSFKQAIYFCECGFVLNDTMIYRKNSYMPQNAKRYEQEYEFIFCFVKGNKPNVFNPIMVKCKNAGHIISSVAYRDSYRSKIFVGEQEGYHESNEFPPHAIKEYKVHGNIFEYTPGSGKKGKHPAVFPYQLAVDQIITWSNEGDVVLDCFMGSGTTAEASLRNNRKFIGCEIIEEYFNSSKERIEDTLSEIYKEE